MKTILAISQLIPISLYAKFANLRGQPPERTSFLTRFCHVWGRYLPRGAGLSDEV